MDRLQLNALAHEWLRLDKDPETALEIKTLLDHQDFAELQRLLGSRLEFGTAGLRARMGAGFARINCLTIIQTSQGLAEYLLEENQGASGIVIGYDARHSSKKFAELAAAVFVAKNIPVYWYEDLVHTPMVPFGVKNLKAAAGIMITASHNPSYDNGYKVYASNACQILSPVDGKIAASILNNLEPITWDVTLQESRRIPVLASLRVKYVNSLEEAIDKLDVRRCPRFVYTPMHGVGLAYMTAVLGPQDRMVVVEDQAQPDPNFPTVQYPNPEESGALDLAKATGDQACVNLIIAHDPDADRFSAAEKVNDQWIQFTGDQVGVLLAQFLLESGKLTSEEWALTTAVSSQMLSVIAKGAFNIQETLTGFKWLGNKAIDLQRHGMAVRFAYEEALGYMLPNIVHDKDGVSAAILFLHACTAWGSPWAKLQHLYQRFGYFETMNTYWKSPDTATTQMSFDLIRASGNPYPDKVAGRRVLRWRDLTKGYDSDTVDHVPLLPSSPDVQMITCWLEGRSSVDNSSHEDEGIRFTLRTSGTEPKIKIYLECQGKVQTAAKDGAAEVLMFIGKEWFADPRLTIEEKYRDRFQAP